MEIKFNGVSQTFGRTKALKDVSTQILPGSIACVMGANGAGKSTLLRLAAGWFSPTDGEITLDDVRISPTRFFPKAHALLLDDSARSDARAVNRIGEMVDAYKADRPDIESEVATWMERLDLVGVYGKRVGQISKGQRYKLAMIGLFVIAPQIWLLDEPYSCGLDAGGLQILESQIRKHVGDGGTLIMSTQWPEHARRMGSQLMVIHDGSLVWDACADTAIDPGLISRATPALRAVLDGINVDHA